MLKIIDQCLDLIFPPRPTELLVRDASSEELVLLFQPNSYASVRYLSSYDNPLIEALIKENKYHENSKATSILAKLLDIWIKSQSSKRLVLIPIPQSAVRAREREYNQVESILNYTRLPEYATINTELIIKSRHTPTQTSLNRNARLTNVRDSFSLTPDAKLEELSEATVVIVDDVVTTGATMRAAQASLAPHLPPNTTLILLALAH